MSDEDDGLKHYLERRNSPEVQAVIAAIKYEEQQKPINQDRIFELLDQFSLLVWGFVGHDEAILDNLDDIDKF